MTEKVKITTLKDLNSLIEKIKRIGCHDFRESQLNGIMYGNIFKMDNVFPKVTSEKSIVEFSGFHKEVKVELEGKTCYKIEVKLEQIYNILNDLLISDYEININYESDEMYIKFFNFTKEQNEKIVSFYTKEHDKIMKKYNRDSE